MKHQRLVLECVLYVDYGMKNEPLAKSVELCYHCVWNVLSLHENAIRVIKSIIRGVSIDVQIVMRVVGYAQHREKQAKFVINVVNHFFRTLLSIKIFFQKKMTDVCMKCDSEASVFDLSTQL